MMKRLRWANSVMIIACCAAFCGFEAKAAPIDPETERTQYLSGNFSGQGIVSKEAMVRAISEYQSFMGTNVTGNTDAETAHLKTLPRCGVRDKVESGTGVRSKRQAVSGSKWMKKNLTYRISKYARDLQRTEVDRDIARAFAVWSDYVDLTFSPTTEEADIDIRFEYGVHGDEQRFHDGPSSSIAHTFRPSEGGDIHFNDDVQWTVDSQHGYNFFQTAVHAVGHSLGLGHSDVESSVMNPAVQAYDPNFKLDEVDIAAIQALYGPKMEGPPQICENPKVDAMLASANGDIYAFKGNYYWKLKSNGAAAEHPKLITEKWKGLPGNIDAAFTYRVWTYFFKGSKYWRYGDQQVGEEPYSGYISHGFPGIPDDIDAATVWAEDRKLYFFKGDQVWEFDSNELRTTSQSISEWRGLPDNLDAAVEYDGYTFFFKDDGHYRFNHNTFSVDQGPPPFPRPNGGWFGCPFPNE